MSRSVTTDSDRSGNRRYNFTVDQLFPSETNKSGTKGKRLDVNTIFSGTPRDPDVVIDMSHEVLIERRKKRKEELQKQYMLTYQNCWKRIDAADADGLTEVTFEVIAQHPRFPEYSPLDCLMLIQNKLRSEEYMDTIILRDNLSIYINWENIENNKQVYLDCEAANATETVRAHTETVRSETVPSETVRSETETDLSEMRREFDVKIQQLSEGN